MQRISWDWLVATAGSVTERRGVDPHLSRGHAGKRCSIVQSVPRWLTLMDLFTIIALVSSTDRRAIDMSITEFGTLVRNMRAEVGASLRDMAEAIGRSPTYVSAVEIGAKALTQDFVNKVAGFFRRKKVSMKKLAGLHATADRTIREADPARQSVDVRSLDAASRIAVATFARRLSDLDQEKREIFVRRVQRAAEKIDQ